MNRESVKLGMWFFGALVAWSPAAISASVAELNKLNFTPGARGASLVLDYRGQAKFRVYQNEAQKNIVLEADNLLLPARLTRKIDASKSTGPVMHLTPYNTGKGQSAKGRIVLQLRNNAQFITTETPGKFVLEILGQSVARNDSASRDEVKTTASAATAENVEVAAKLTQVLNAPPNEKVYFGKSVTFEGTDVDIHDTFRLVGEASGLNIITDSDARGRVTLSLKDVPWDQLLDIVVQQSQLKALVRGNVVRIVTVAKYNLEQQQTIETKVLEAELEPEVMSVIPLSFATVTEMQPLLNSLLGGGGTTTTAIALNNPAGGPSASGQNALGGSIMVDARTNSLIVKNTKEYIDRVRRLVQELDVPLPQVLIDAKIVIATENFSKSVGVSWGGAASSSGSGRAGGLAGFNQDSLTLGAESSTFAISPGVNPVGFAAGFRVGAGQHGNLNASLSLAELNGASKTVASPRVIVNNKKSATITDGQTIQVSTPGGANVAGGLTSVTANMSLSVTPQVTSGGSVLMVVSLTKDVITSLNPITTENKLLSTDVLVESGSTLVLGGVYQIQGSKNETGIPLLKDLPFLGQLFRTNTEANAKSELMVFITPQILDASPQGLQTN